ncbi:hypothetical protein CRENBAI_004538 [Crenichthys baileyi]|uniref:Oxo-4-hydroxy-4-carboxy-5-ureidoimidazoline decarboxylase domain-containing protein n=1 Tax=Crenichthys baileyi TaxID=28760 RepID=A0AAV9SNK0_9TELE
MDARSYKTEGNRHKGCTAAEKREEYKRRFGFPFVICARTTNKTCANCASCSRGVLPKERESAAAEMARGIEEVKKSCRAV